MNLRLLLLAFTAYLPLLSNAQVGTGVILYSDAEAEFTPTTVDSTATLLLTVGNELGVPQSIDFTGLAAPFSIEGPQSITIESASTQDILISFNPSELGLVQDTLLATGSVFGSASLPLSGEGIQVLLEWSADTLFFDTTAIGATSYQDLIITNVGNGTAAITDVQIDNDAFSVEFLDPYVAPTPQAPCYTIPANDYGGDFDVPYREFYLTIEGGAFPDELYWNIYDPWGAYNYSQYGPVTDYPICLPDNWNLPTNPDDYCCYNYFEFYTQHDLYNPVFTDGIVFTIRDEWNNEVWSFDLGDWPDWNYGSSAHITTGNPPAGPDFTPGFIGEGLSTIARTYFTPSNAGLEQAMLTLYNSSSETNPLVAQLRGTGIAEISGSLCDMTLTPDDSPYALTDDINIPAGCTLLIHAGTEINGNGFSINTSGTLHIHGTQDSVVTINETQFTSSGYANEIIVKHAHIYGELPSYLPGTQWTFPATNSITSWAVPVSGYFSIEAKGASGGFYSNNQSETPGYGSHLSGQFELIEGQTLQILAGSAGESWSHTGGGGGGSFVAEGNSLQTATPLVVAGGGGGAGESGGHGYNASLSDNGTNGHGGYGAGTNGYGNSNTDNGGWGSGGAGFYGNGTPTYNNGSQSALAFVNGGDGGPASTPSDYGSCSGARGGFGGGGAGACNGGGGGGGYSGGGQGGGGGGSFNSGSNQINLIRESHGDGLIVITLLSGANTGNHMVLFADSLAIQSTNMENYSIALSSNKELLFDSSSIDGSGSLHLQSENISIEQSSISISSIVSPPFNPTAIDTTLLNIQVFDTLVEYSGQIQDLQLPLEIDYLYIDAFGAQGGNSGSYSGGRGARASCYLAPPVDNTLRLLIGQKAPDRNCAAGGGGGTFVATSENEPLVIAGGGSGATCSSNGNPGMASEAGGHGDSCSTNGGVEGNGGGASILCGNGTGGGGGFYTDGSNASDYGHQFGHAFVNGGLGGVSDSGGAIGGFGGGAGTHTNNTGGGPGGGYSGGGAPNHGDGYSGGGGGSFTLMDQGNTTTDVNNGHGKVHVTAFRYLNQDSASQSTVQFWDELTPTSLSLKNGTITQIESDTPLLLAPLSDTISISVHNSGLAGLNAIAQHTQMTVLESTISNGSGISVSGDLNLNLQSSNIQNNNGNGIYSINGSSNISISNCTINFNQGSGVHAQNDSEVMVVASNISDNDQNGILLPDANSICSVDFSFIQSNNADGITSGEDADINVTNSLIGYNSGNGISSNGGIQIKYSNIIHNEASGIYSSLFSTINNSIVWFNGSVPQLWTDNTFAISYTNVQGINALLTSTEFAWGDGCIGTDPVLADSLGHLDPFSPCVDSGMPWEQDAHIPYGLGSSRADMGMYGGPANAYWGGQAPPDGAVVITDIFDIPQDQGGKLGMHFTASPFDFGGLGFNVTHYSVWRDLSLGSDVPTIVGDGNWEQIGEVPAQGFSQYGYTAETLVDATPGDTTCLSSFIVIAHTTDDNIYWVSDVAAACSYDNLAPAAPELDGDVLMEGDGGATVVVSWPAPEEEDYAYTVIERADGMSTNVVGDTLLLDTEVEPGLTYDYFGYHIDLNGNPSDTAYVTVLVGAQRDVIALSAGWNLISLDRTPVDAEVEVVMADLEPGNLLYVTGFDAGATFYDPEGLPFLNTLTDLEDGYGYWVKVAADDTLRVEGTALPAGYLPTLDAGWNLVAYTAPEAETPSAVFSELMADDALLYVTGFDGGVSIFDPGGLPFLNSLTALENGYGYWVKTEADYAGMGLVDGDTPDGMAAASVSRANPAFDILNGTSDLGNRPGAFVEVLGPDGRSVGQMEVLPGGLLMTAAIYGDDASTPEIEGLTEGAVLHFAYNGRIASESAIWQGAMAHLKLDLHFGAGAALNVFPNPLEDNASIQYEIAEAGRVRLEVLDALGRVVSVLFEGDRSAGMHQTTWRATDLAPGSYAVRLSLNGTPLSVATSVKL